MSSELLDDYEEGTWTATCTGGFAGDHVICMQLSLPGRTGVATSSSMPRTTAAAAAGAPFTLPSAAGATASPSGGSRSLSWFLSHLGISLWWLSEAARPRGREHNSAIMLTGNCLLVLRAPANASRRRPAASSRHQAAASRQQQQANSNWQGEATAGSSWQQ